jgi:hypothetical protein
MGQGGPINAAVGNIIINTAQAQQAVPVMQGVAAGINQAMGGIAGSTAKAQAGISQFASALGFGLGAAGITQLGRMALEANAIAVAFDRQTVAARNLAGGQEKLNALMAAYDRATAGAVDQAQAMADVTRLQAVGMADNAQQLERFVTAARGASIAMGRSTQDILGEVQLAVANQSFRRLDQIGLGVEEVRQRMDELKASTAGMTTEAAFQEAVIQKLTEKYGALAKSAEAAPTGIEASRIALKDFRLEVGELSKGLVDFTGDAFANWIKQAGQDIKTASDFLGPFVHQFQELQWMIQGKSIAFQNGLNIRQPTLLPSAANFNQMTGGTINPNQTEIDATKLDWGKGIQQLNADTNKQLLEQNQSYQDQRSSSERQYQESTLRAAQDFALSRAREEQDLADSISRIHRDSAEREAQEAADLARTIAQAESDSADKVAKAKKDSTKQLADLDANYEKERVKRAKDLSDQLMDAAGNLDAKQVYELQRNAAKQEEEAKQSHDDQRDKLKTQLQERLDDESKSLARSIRQQQDAYDRQIQAGRDADAQRIQDMRDDAKKRQDQENQDYGIRMDRARQDHADQLDEMERQQGLRIQQIKDHAGQERDQLDTEHESALVKLGVLNQQWIDAETKLNNDALKLLEPLLKAGRSLLLFPNASGLSAPLVTPNVSNAYGVPGALGSGGNSYSNSNHNFAPTVYLTIPGGNQSDAAIKKIVHDALIEVYEEISR